MINLFLIYLLIYLFINYFFNRNLLIKLLKEFGLLNYMVGKINFYNLLMILENKN